MFERGKYYDSINLSHHFNISCLLNNKDTFDGLLFDGIPTYQEGLNELLEFNEEL